MKRTSPDDDDVTLMACAAAGDSDAFRIIVERHQNPLLNFFLRAGVSYDDGLDLVQRTFLRLWRYRLKYEPKAKFTTFLYMLANQEKLDFYRGEGRRGRLEDRLERAAEDKVTAGVMNADGPSSVPCRATPDPAPSAPDDEGMRVRRAVAALSPALRDVVELGVFQDLPYADIGETLGIPVGTVKSRMFNALRKLKELLT